MYPCWFGLELDSAKPKDSDRDKRTELVFLKITPTYSGRETPMTPFNP